MTLAVFSSKVKCPAPSSLGSVNDTYELSEESIRPKLSAGFLSVHVVVHGYSLCFFGLHIDSMRSFDCDT